MEEKPVFIDQTPDYGQAIAQIALLSQQPDRLRAVAQELGMGAELAKFEAAGGNIRAQAEGLIRESKSLEDRDAALNARMAKAARLSTLVGDGAMIGTGAAMGIVGSRRQWSVVKTGLAGLAAAAAVGGAWLAGSVAWKKHLEASPNVTALAQDATRLEIEKHKLVDEQIALGTRFVSDMATRMLSQQKMLAGEGEAMHLESTKAPALADAMAARYATVPAASKAEALSSMPAPMQR